MEPGTAMTSRPCSPARRAVMSEPDRAAASITSTPRERPDISRLRCGKFSASGGVRGRKLADERAARRDRGPRARVLRRVHAVEAGAADRDRDAARGECAAVRRGIDADREPARDREAVRRRARAANSKAVSRPAAVAARLPTIATCGTREEAGSPRRTTAAACPARPRAARGYRGSPGISEQPFGRDPLCQAQARARSPAGSWPAAWPRKRSSQATGSAAAGPRGGQPGDSLVTAPARHARANGPPMPAFGPHSLLTSGDVPFRAVTRVAAS